MPIRYSGRVRLDIELREVRDPARHNAVYVITASSGGKRLGKVSVHPPAALSRSIDSPKAFDDAASAALSFLDDEGKVVRDLADHQPDGSGWYVETEAQRRHRVAGGGAPIVRPALPTGPGAKYLTIPIVEARRSNAPAYGIASSGYTKRSGAPTSIEIRLQGEGRWRRVMTWQFSNSGTLFVKIGNESYIVRHDSIPLNGR